MDGVKGVFNWRTTSWWFLNTFSTGFSLPRFHKHDLAGENSFIQFIFFLQMSCSMLQSSVQNNGNPHICGSVRNLWTKFLEHEDRIFWGPPTESDIWWPTCCAQKRVHFCFSVWLQSLEWFAVRSDFLHNIQFRDLRFQVNIFQQNLWRVAFLCLKSHMTLDKAFANIFPKLTVPICWWVSQRCERTFVQSSQTKNVSITLWNISFRQCLDHGFRKQFFFTDNSQKTTNKHNNFQERQKDFSSSKVVWRTPKLQIFKKKKVWWTLFFRMGVVLSLTERGSLFSSLVAILRKFAENMLTFSFTRSTVARNDKNFNWPKTIVCFFSSKVLHDLDAGEGSAFRRDHPYARRSFLLQENNNLVEEFPAPLSTSTPINR